MNLEPQRNGERGGTAGSYHTGQTPSLSCFSDEPGYEVLVSPVYPIEDASGKHRVLLYGRLGQFLV